MPALAAPTISMTGVITLAAVGSSPNANGMTLNGQALNLEPASGAQPGIVTTGAQTLGAGIKTFSSVPVAPGIGGTTAGAAVWGVGDPAGVGGGYATLHLAATPSNVNYALLSGGAHLYINAPTSGGIYFRCNNVTTANFDPSGNLMPVPAQITAGSATGMTVNFNGAIRDSMYKVTLDKTAWTAAALTQDITIGTLPAGAIVRRIVCDTTAALTNGASTLAMTIGSAAGGTQFILSHDVKTAPITKGLADADLGANMVRSAAIQGGYAPNWTGTTIVSVRLTSGSVNLGNGSTTNLTTGSTTIYLMVSVPQA